MCVCGGGGGLCVFVCVCVLVPWVRAFVKMCVYACMYMCMCGFWINIALIFVMIWYIFVPLLAKSLGSAK